MQLINKLLKNGIDITEYYLMIKMMKLPFKATWLEVGVFEVTEINHRQKAKNDMLLFIYDFFSLFCVSLSLDCVSHAPLPRFGSFSYLFDCLFCPILVYLFYRILLIVFRHLFVF